MNQNTMTDDLDIVIPTGSSYNDSVVCCLLLFPNAVGSLATTFQRIQTDEKYRNSIVTKISSNDFKIVTNLQLSSSGNKIKYALFYKIDNGIAKCHRLLPIPTDACKALICNHNLK